MTPGLATIKARCLAASADWSVSERRYSDGGVPLKDREVGPVRLKSNAGEGADAAQADWDVAFLAYAREDLLALIAEVEAARALRRDGLDNT